jgi:hypothetical protein
MSNPLNFKNSTAQVTTEGGYFQRVQRWLVPQFGKDVSLLPVTLTGDMRKAE